MTNKPNLPVSPMLNMRAVKDPKAGTVTLNAGADGVTLEEVEAKPAPVDDAEEAQETATNGEGENEKQEGINDMDINAIKEKFGLPAEATDEELAQAIDAVLAKCAGMEGVQNALGLEPTCSNEDVISAINAVLEQGEALQNAQCDPETANAELEEIKTAQRNAEADALVAENEDVIPEESVEEVKAQYVEDPEAAMQTVANMRKVYERAIVNAKRSVKVDAPKHVINFRQAKAPVAINMDTMLADCGGDPAKENEKLRAMNAK